MPQGSLYLLKVGTSAIVGLVVGEFVGFGPMVGNNVGELLGAGGAGVGLEPPRALSTPLQNDIRFIDIRSDSSSSMLTAALGPTQQSGSLENAVQKHAEKT